MNVKIDKRYTFGYNKLGWPEEKYEDWARYYRGTLTNLAYKDEFDSLLLKSLTIILSSEEMEKIKTFARKFVKAKQKEKKKEFCEQMYKRILTGAICEYAFLKFLGKESSFDFSISTKSEDYDVPDLLQFGVYCGVKGCENGKVPLVFNKERFYKENGIKYRCAEVICVCDDNQVWFLGIASPEVLLEYVDDNLVIQGTKHIGDKTGFWGTRHLLPIPSDWNEMKEMCNKLVQKSP